MAKKVAKFRVRLKTRGFLQAAERTARAADVLGQSFARALSSVLRDTERRLIPLVKDAAEGSPTAIIKAAQANDLRKQLRDTLRASGYDDLADIATSDRLDTLVSSVLDRRKLARLSAAMNPRVEGRIAALKALMHLDLLDEGDRAAKALWTAMTRGIFGSRPTDSILSDLGRVIDRTAPQIETLYDTSISVFGRQVEALQAGHDPATKFAFLGPVDDRIRTFCRRHVGHVYTREQIDALDNQQLDNVFLTGGGYNCRHVWQEIGRFSELYNYGPDQRIPEVETDLRHLKKAA